MGVTTVRLQPELEESLEAMARKLHRSKGWIINQALTGYLERENLEQRRWQETLAAMESVTQGKVVAAEEVHAWLRSWGDAEELTPPKAGGGR